MYKIEVTEFVKRKIKKLTVEQSVTLSKVFSKLEIDPFSPSLKMHKLAGKFADRYSCRLNYKDRVIFIIIVEKTILIVDIGDHDSVY